MSAALPALLVPFFLAELARAQNMFFGHVRFTTWGGAEFPLPTMSVWIVLGVLSALLYLVVAGTVALALRRQTVSRRNLATLVILAVSLPALTLFLGKTLGLVGVNSLGD